MFILNPYRLGSANNYFNPGDKDASFTLSNANATAVHGVSGDWDSVRSITSHSTGKWYAEVNLDSADGSGYSIFGVATSAADIDNYCGAGTTSWGLRFTGTTPVTFNNATPSADLGTGISVNQRAMVAYDADTGKIWFGMNGTWVSGGDPGAGTGQQYTATANSVLLLMLSSFGTLTYTLKNNAGENAHSIPSGFSMWG